MATTEPEGTTPAVVEQVLKAVEDDLVTESDVPPASTIEKVLTEEDKAALAKKVASPRMFSKLLSPKKKPQESPLKKAPSNGDQIVTPSSLRKKGFFGTATLVRKPSSDKEIVASAETPEKPVVSTPAETPETAAAATPAPEKTSTTTTTTSVDKTVRSPSTPQSSSSSVDSPAPSGFSPAASNPNDGEDLQPLSDKAKKSTLGGKLKGAFTKKTPTKKTTSPTVVTAVSDALAKAEAELESPKPPTVEEQEKDKAEALKAMAEVQALVQQAQTKSSETTEKTIENEEEEAAAALAAALDLKRAEEEEAARAKAEAIKAMEEAQAESKAREEALKIKAAPKVTDLSATSRDLPQATEGKASSRSPTALVKQQPASVTSDMGEMVKMTFIFSYIIIMGGAVVYLFASLSLRHGVFSL